jgi:hypothetical protein
MAMEKKEAQLIANETLFILVRQCKTAFPGAYEFFTGQMDIIDEELIEADKLLND